MEEDWAAFVDLRQEAHCANAVKSVERNLAQDGRVHPRINSIGAKTGRMSITGPPMQAMPYQLRPAFLADEGMTLVAVDLDRAEPCLVAAVSEDPGLVAAASGDIYLELAAKIWGEDARSDPERRVQAKTSLNAIVYGQGAQGLGRRLGVTTDEAQAILDGWSAAYPAFAKWKRGIISKAKKGQAPTTLAGRRTRQPEHPYQAISYVIQGTAADVFKTLMLEVASALPDGFDLWLPVHDELIIHQPHDPAAIYTALEILTSHVQCEVQGVHIGGTPGHMGRAWQKI
jgi:DNA polymerase-1